MSHNFCNITKATFVGALLAFATACTYDNSLCVEDRPTYEEGNDLWLSVDVRSLSPNAGRAARASRADDSGHPDEAGSIAENCINVDDVKILFVGAEGYVMRVLQPGDYTVVRESQSDDYTTYTLAFKINREYFKSTSTNPNFKLMVVANTKGPDTNSNPDFWLPTTWAKSPEQVGALLSTFSYSPTLGTPWLPSIVDKKLIPMTGIVTTSYTQASIEQANTRESAFDAGTINMQRAMAKLRCIDIIQETDPTMTGIYISDVRLLGYANQGAYFPSSTIPYSEEGFEEDYNANFASWYTYGAQPIEKPTMLEAWYVDDDTLSTQKVTFVEGSGSAAKSYDAFIGYMPEYNTDVLLESTSTPRLEVDVTGIDGPDDVKTFTYSLSRSDIRQIARNHIYEFRINVETNIKLGLTVDVKDWESETFEYELKDIVEVDKTLEWATEGSQVFSTGEKPYNSKPEMQLTIVADGADDKAVTGTFKINSPKGATWTAYFIPGENGSGAFEFVDVNDDGTIVPGSGKGSVSGKVGEEATIHLHAANPADALDHYAELVVEVRSVDDHVQYAPIGLNGSTRYIIYRQKKI